jgi:hypothetical protein
MVSLISENPWPLIYICLAVALVGLVALRITQRAKFLIWTLGALGLAVLLWVIDWLWVTDVERIEQVVHDLAHAVARSDSDAVVKLLDPDVSLSQEGNGLIVGSELARGRLAITFIRTGLENVRFDFVSVSHLQTTAGAISGQGKCDFRVDAMGSLRGPSNSWSFGPSGSDWSLGFVRTPSGVWKIHRITAVRLPGSTSLRLPGILGQ